MQRWNASFAQFLKNIEIRKRINTRCDFIAAAIFIFSQLAPKDAWFCGADLW